MALLGQGPPEGTLPIRRLQVRSDCALRKLAVQMRLVLTLIAPAL